MPTFTAQKKVNLMKRFIYLIGVLLIAMACKEVFEAPPQALLRASFYDSTSKKPIEPQITVQGVGRDSLWAYNLKANNMLLPLTNKDTTLFIIWLDSKSDSLIFTHETTKKYASMETGFYYEHKLKSVRFTSSRIDSLIIIDSLVTTKWNENIKLYINSLPVSDN